MNSFYAQNVFLSDVEKDSPLLWTNLVSSDTGEKSV